MPRFRLSNYKIMFFVLDELEGAGRFVHVEDLFERAWRLSPDRFSWRTKEYPNYKLLHKALSDCDEKRPGFLIKGGGGLERRLSSDGIKWVEKHRDDFIALIGKDDRLAPVMSAVGRRDQRRLLELEKSKLVRSFKADKGMDGSKYQIADILMCSPGSPSSVWKRKLDTLKSACERYHRTLLVEFLDEVEQLHPDWFVEDTT